MKQSEYVDRTQRQYETALARAIKIKTTLQHKFKFGNSMLETGYSRRCIFCTAYGVVSYGMAWYWLLFFRTQDPLIIGEQSSCTSKFGKMHRNGKQVEIEKTKANMASDIRSHWHLMGPALMAGTHAENGVPSPQIFHFNHWLVSRYLQNI